MQGNWKSDGTDLDGKATWVSTANGEEGSSSSTHEISTTGSGGSPMNLLYIGTDLLPRRDAEGRLSYFFKVQVTEMTKFASLSVGVARPEEFQKGYKLRGMFYNGNLTNAAAALKVSFGPRLKQGDTMIIEYSELENETIQFKIVLNGTPLGMGFQIPKTNTSFVPCLSVQGSMTLNTDVLFEKPNVAPAGPVALFGGKWAVTQIATSENAPRSLWPIADVDHKVILNIEKDPSAGGDDGSSQEVWVFSIKIANTFGIHKMVRESASGCYTVQNSHGGMVRSTRMMPPPPLQQLERDVPDLMSNHWVKLVASDSVMEIQSENGATVVRCHRIVPSLTEPACTSYKN